MQFDLQVDAQACRCQHTRYSTPMRKHIAKRKKTTIKHKYIRIFFKFVVFSKLIFTLFYLLLLFPFLSILGIM